MRVAPSTILRWVVLLASLRAAGRRFLAHGRNLPQCARPIGFTFTGPSTNKAKRLSPTFTRDVTAAKAFFRKAFRRHGDPRVDYPGDYPGTASNRPMPLCVAWREQRIQLALGGRRSNPHLPVFEQRRRTGPPAHQGPGGPDARVQALLQRPAGSGRHRAGSQDHQRPVWSARELCHGPLTCMV